MLITILLISFGLVDVNANNINNLFNTISSWLPKIGGNIRNNAFIQIDGLKAIFFIFGIALSTYQAKNSTKKTETVE